MRPRLEKGGLVDQKAPNKAYDTVKFVEEHYEELRQWYLDIMERISHLETVIAQMSSTTSDSSDTNDTPTNDQEGNENNGL